MTTPSPILPMGEHVICILFSSTTDINSLETISSQLWNTCRDIPVYTRLLALRNKRRDITRLLFLREKLTRLREVIELRLDVLKHEDMIRIETNKRKTQQTKLTELRIGYPNLPKTLEELNHTIPWIFELLVLITGTVETKAHKFVKRDACVTCSFKKEICDSCLGCFSPFWPIGDNDNVAMHCTHQCNQFDAEDILVILRPHYSSAENTGFSYGKYLVSMLLK